MCIRDSVAGGQPGAHGLDVVERGPASLPGVAHDLPYACEHSASAVLVLRGREIAHTCQPVVLPTQVMAHSHRLVDDDPRATVRDPKAWPGRPGAHRGWRGCPRRPSGTHPV